MTPEEIINGIAQIDGDVTRPTLTRYEHWGLISKPKRGSKGRGIGRWTDYPHVTIAEAFAAWSMINGKYPLPCTLRTCIRLSPETVCSGKINAVHRYKREKAEKINEYGEKIQILDEYEQLIKWEDENGFIEYPDIKSDNEEPELFNIYIRLISFTSRLWDYEFRRAYNLYRNLKSQ